MLRLDTFIVAEFVSMLNFFYKKMPGSRLATPTFIIEPFYCVVGQRYTNAGLFLFVRRIDYHV